MRGRRPPRPRPRRQARPAGRTGLRPCGPVPRATRRRPRRGVRAGRVSGLGATGRGRTRQHTARARPARPELSWNGAPRPLRPRRRGRPGSARAPASARARARRGRLVSARLSWARRGRGGGRLVCGTGPVTGRLTGRRPRRAAHAGQRRVDPAGHRMRGSRPCRCGTAGNDQTRRARRQGAVTGRWNKVRGVGTVDARTRSGKGRGLRPPAGLGQGIGVRSVERCGPVEEVRGDGRNRRGERRRGGRAPEDGEQREEECGEHRRRRLAPPARDGRRPERLPGAREAHRATRDARTARPLPVPRRTHLSSPSGPSRRPFITYQQADPPTVRRDRTLTMQYTVWKRHCRNDPKGVPRLPPSLLRSLLRQADRLSPARRTPRVRRS